MNKFELNEIKVVDNIEVMFENKIVLYGAGNYGKIVCDYMRDSGIEIIGFCDSDIMRWGTTYLGIDIYSPMELGEICKIQNVMVVITVQNNTVIDDILSVMEKYQIRPALICTMYAVGLGMALHDDCSLFNSQFAQMHKMKTWSWQKGFMKYVEHRDVMSSYEACNAMAGENAILIYQPGKVASSTIFKTLNTKGIKSTHFHTFKCEKELLQGSIRCGKKIKIITGVREPISRDISAYFQIMSRWLLACKKDILKKGIYEAFHELYEKSGYIQGIVLSGNEFDWFDRELKANFGIDIYNYPFDKEKGYSVISTDKIDVFLYKCEKLNCLENALKDFLRTDNFNLVIANDAHEKKYKYMYDEFKSNVSIDEEYVMKYYNSEKVRHFYSVEELDGMKKKWLKEI